MTIRKRRDPVQKTSENSDKDKINDLFIAEFSAIKSENAGRIAERLTIIVLAILPAVWYALSTPDDKAYQALGIAPYIMCLSWFMDHGLQRIRENAFYIWKYIEPLFPNGIPGQEHFLNIMRSFDNRGEIGIGIRSLFFLFQIGCTLDGGVRTYLYYHPIDWWSKAFIVGLIIDSVSMIATQFIIKRKKSFAELDARITNKRA